MTAKNISALLFIAFIVALFSPKPAHALTKDELLRLKSAGVPEDVIVVMVENNYQDIDKVIALKEAGFKDKTLSAIIRGETTHNALGEKFTYETTVRAKIMWYLVFRGKPILQNSEVIENARLFLVDNAALKLEWKEESGLGLLDELKKKAFKSPFYWTLNRDDRIDPGDDGYPFILKSTNIHQGQPETDSDHYWLLYLDPKDKHIIDSVKNNLP